MAQAHGQPWLPARPFWESLPDDVAAGLREDYEEKAAKLEHESLMCKGLAEAAAYAFMFTDRPDVISPFVNDDEIAHQIYLAGSIRRHYERWKAAYEESFRPWVIQRKEHRRIL